MSSLTDLDPFDLTSTRPGENNLPPRSTFSSSLGALSLNGIWKFHWSPNPHAAPDGVGAEEFDDSDFDDLTVPSSWPMHGYGRPAYTNVQFPFPVDPPHPPDANPVGDHRLRFDVDERFDHGAVLRFDGIDNAGEIWLNGVRLGTTRGSRLPAEFDVSGVLRRQGNVLVVRVVQFSATSYVEDQDMWWLPGLFRDVTVIARPAGAIRDVVVHTDFDGVGSASGPAELRVEVLTEHEVNIELAELGLTGTSGQTYRLDDVEPWSAEVPRLYQLVITTDLERVELPIGFRRVSVVDRQLMINGRPILIKGVNRHEHHPDFGRVIPSELVRSELALMKQHNVNAIRTSHYPPHPQMLALADELGFYVIDECDLETHGFQLNANRRNPSADPAWREALVHRMRTMVSRDRNHPCIFSWSVGNESGVGDNLAAMAAAARQLDPTRLIHYENDRDMAWADVYSLMYTRPELVDQIGRGEEPLPEHPEADEHRRALPFLLCEYAHAMGNGPGGLSDYQRVFEAHPRLAGGFIWEWLEHGIRLSRDGENYFGYGGDFGEPVHDGVFVIDGLVSADRKPRPALQDLKKVYEPVRITVGETWRTARVQNLFVFAGLDDVRLSWSVQRDGEQQATGELAAHCAAGEAIELDLPATCVELRGGGAVLTVSAVLAADRPWARAGHELAWGQAVAAADTPEVSASVAPELRDEQVHLGPARFDQATGRLCTVGGVAVDGPDLTLWRAPTDNDNGKADDGAEESEAVGWRRTGLDRLITRVAGIEVDGNELVVRQRVGVAIADRAIDLILRWRSDGTRLAVRVELRPDERWPGSWPRIGLDLRLPGELDQVRWAGRGPGQAYPDTGQSQRWGRFHSDVAGLQVDYVRPQENGSRRATKLIMSDPDGAGSLTIDATGAEFGFAARPWSPQVLTAATHTPDLVPDGSIHLTLDHRQHGIGTASCGPGVLPPYRLIPADLGDDDRVFEFTFSLS